MFCAETGVPIPNQDDSKGRVLNDDDSSNESNGKADAYDDAEDSSDDNDESGNPPNKQAKNIAWKKYEHFSFKLIHHHCPNVDDTMNNVVMVRTIRKKIVFI